MSHVATVALEIKDLPSLAEACRRLGLEFREGQKQYRWWGHSVGDYPIPDGFTEDDLGKCEHAIAVPESKWNKDSGEKPYEIGVVRRRDGKPGWCLMWDFIAGGFGIQDFVGPECNKLKQQYAVVTTEKIARQQGMRVQQSVGTDGRIVLRLTK